MQKLIIKLEYHEWYQICMLSIVPDDLFDIECGPMLKIYQFSRAQKAGFLISIQFYMVIVTHWGRSIGSPLLNQVIQEAWCYQRKHMSRLWVFLFVLFHLSFLTFPLLTLLFHNFSRGILWVFLTIQSFIFKVVF